MKSNPTPVTRSRFGSSLSLLAALLAFVSVAAQAQTKWNPGHYMRVYLEKVGSDTDPSKSVQDSTLNSISGESSIKGVVVPYSWAVLEGPTAGSYDFHRIDHQLEVLSAMGKRLIVDVLDEGFSAPWTSMHTDILPAYLETLPGGGGGWAAMNGGGTAKVWLEPVMTRYIALLTAMAARYDGNPYFEMISGAETARSFNATYPAPADYTLAAYITQLQRWGTEMRAAWPTTNVFLGTNFLNAGSNGDMQNLVQSLLQNRIAMGGPDIRINSATATQGTQVINGLVGTLGDVRGQIALRYEHQVLLNPTDTMTLLYDNAVVQTNGNALEANHIPWLRKDGASIPDDWEDDVLPFLQSHPDTISAVPTSFGVRGWYKFDETSGVTANDFSGYSANATLHTGASWNSSGRLGGGLNLNGSTGYAALPSTGQPTYSTGMTIALWAYPEASNNYSRFIDFSEGQGNDNIIFTRNGTTDVLAFQVYNGSSAGTKLTTAAGAIALNTWQHFAATVDGSGNAKIYKNGVQVAAGTVNVPASVSRNQNYIGRSAWSGDGYYDGKIDDLQVYDRVLSAAEIGGLVNNGSPEVYVRGHGLAIADGDTTPTTADDTEFGSVNVAGGTVTRVFTIANIGTTALTVGSVSISGTTQFTVTVQPAASVAAGGSTTFSIKFDPSATGLKNGDVTFTTNDANEGTYNFTVQGTGI